MDLFENRISLIHGIEAVSSIARHVILHEQAQ